MSDLTKMESLVAIRWWIENETAVRDLADVERLVTVGIVDTDTILRLIDSDGMDLIDQVPNMAITEQNINLLGAVGPRVVNEDWDNAEAWAAVSADMSDDDESLPYEYLEAFLDAGRAPSFARKVLEHLRARDRYDINPARFDLTLPFGHLTDLIDANLTDDERDRWRAIGVESVPTMIELREAGLTHIVARKAREEGFPISQWKQFAVLPDRWVRTGNQDEGWTLEALVQLHTAGWRTSSYHGPWMLPLTGKRTTALRVTPEQALLLAEAGMQPEDAGRMLSEAMPEGRGRMTQGSPPHLLNQWVVNTGNTLVGALAEQVAALWKAGVRPSHLKEYRWAGCHSYADILRATAIGIDPKRVRMLREKYGKPASRYGLQTLRIQDWTALVQADAIERGEASHVSS